MLSKKPASRFDRNPWTRHTFKVHRTIASTAFAIVVPQPPEIVFDDLIQADQMLATRKCFTRQQFRWAFAQCIKGLVDIHYLDTDRSVLVLDHKM